MERVPVTLEEQQVGTLSVREEGLYVRYRAEYRLQKPEVLRLYALGERGELRLGTPEPRNGVFLLERRISAREAAAPGRLLRGELRRPGEDGPAWQAAQPGTLFSEERLRRQVRDCAGALVRQKNGGRQVALPFDCSRPFPLPELFCFASIRTIGGQQYAVFTFDAEGRPVF